jgi:hypothetical protein
MRRTALAGGPVQSKGFGVVSRGASLPAPVEGWDALSPLSEMPPKRAVALDNWFPQPGYLELRRGHVEHSDTGSGEPVESVMAYHGAGGTLDLKAAADGVIWDVTAAAAAVSEIVGQANNRWQHVNFTTIDGNNFLWICNGANDSRRWDGAAWSVNTISGGITGPDVVHVAVFKGRLWLTVNGSLNPWYLGVGAVQGAAVEFPLRGVFREGGFLQAIGTWSLDAGAGPDDIIAFISSRGEVAVYSGIDPAADFTLKGVYTVGPPIGRRCLTAVGGDIMLISIDGVLPLSQALVVERGVQQTVAITKLIQPVVSQSARDFGANFGWQLQSYPRGTRAILNVPVAEGADQRQYVMNTVTGAWCQFIGQAANCWEVLDDRLYMGGNDGIVYEADVGGNDAGAPIVFDLRTAFNYFRSRGRNKRFSMCRPLLTTDGSVVPGLAVNTDFGRDAPISVSSTIVDSVALWDVAMWDVDVWPIEERIIADWQTVVGVGYCASVRMTGNLMSTHAPILRINGFDLLMEDGAFI